MLIIPPRLRCLSYLSSVTIICLVSVLASGQTIRSSADALAVATRFAPVFYQGLGDDPRADLITKFDFDNDWRGDNNWVHLADETFPLKAFIYYAVSETRSHLFIHYAVFHPRDYKGGATRGRILSEIINEGVKRGGNLDPTGLSAEATLAHENDMEGCLVVVAKDGSDLSLARVVFVETVAHNHFLRYGVEAREGISTVSLDGQHPLLYIEPKGHGIQAYAGNEKEKDRKLLQYSYRNRADAPTVRSEAASYDLLPIQTTIWLHAKKGVNETFGTKMDYGVVTVSVASANGKARNRTVRIGVLGSAFLGKVGGPNMARPPWGWFDQDERKVSPGEWFFNPATTIKRHFKLGEDYSTAYTWQPFLRVGLTK